MKDTDAKKKMNAGELAQLALFCALMVVGKEAVQVIPNVHPVTFLLILCTCCYGRRALYPALAFALIEISMYGFGMWSMTYLYIWPLQVLTALPFRSERSPIFWAAFAAIHGFAFGGLCCLLTLFVVGPKAALAFWITGLSYDVIHGVSNAVITGLLYRPMMRVMERLRK